MKRKRRNMGNSCMKNPNETPTQSITKQEKGSKKQKRASERPAEATQDTVNQTQEASNDIHDRTNAGNAHGNIPGTIESPRTPSAASLTAITTTLELQEHDQTTNQTVSTSTESEKNDLHKPFEAERDHAKTANEPEGKYTDLEKNDLQKKFDEERTELKGQIKKLEDDIKKINETSSEKDKELHVERKRNEGLSGENVTLESSNQALEAEKLDLQARYDRLSKENATNNSLRKTLETEKQELLTRLSAAVGSKLTDNNADIADLSDMNRPTKLAEFYSELYDNQWTDAFDILTKDDKRTEEGACTRLLMAFMRIYDVSRKKADEELKGLKEAVGRFQGTTEVTPELIKRMKDERKRRHKQYMPELKQVVKPTLKDLFGDKKERKEIRPFLSRSLELCWLMAVQDPPVAIDTNQNRSGEPFNSKILKPYTKSGKIIDYIVWPVLYLYENGGVLCKGIAQGQATAKKIPPDSPDHNIKVPTGSSNSVGNPAKGKEEIKAETARKEGNEMNLSQSSTSREVKQSEIEKEHRDTVSVPETNEESNSEPQHAEQLAKSIDPANERQHIDKETVRSRSEPNINTINVSPASTVSKGSKDLKEGISKDGATLLEKQSKSSPRKTPASTGPYVSAGNENGAKSVKKENPTPSAYGAGAKAWSSKPKDKDKKTGNQSTRIVVRVASTKRK